MNEPVIFGKDGLPKGKGYPKKNYRNENGVLLKRCTDCGRFYRLHRFYIFHYVRDGEQRRAYRSWCKFCMSEDTVNEP